MSRAAVVLAASAIVIYIPTQTREKGFVDKEYKCYFLGIDRVTQAYICWVIGLSVERVSADVLFHELTQIRV